MITPRDIQVLLCLVRYFVLSRPQIQRLLFTDDTNGRSMRYRYDRSQTSIDAWTSIAAGVVCLRIVLEVV